MSQFKIYICEGCPKRAEVSESVTGQFTAPEGWSRVTVTIKNKSQRADFCPSCTKTMRISGGTVGGTVFGDSE